MTMKSNFFLFLFATIGLLSCETEQLIHVSSPGNQLFKVTILYPSGEGKTFDLAYYQNKHMPMVAEFLGDNLKFYEVDQGVAGRTANDEVPFVAAGHFYVKDVSEYNKSIGKNI